MSSLIDGRLAVYVDINLPKRYVQQIEEVLQVGKLPVWEGRYPIGFGTPDSGLVRGDTVLVFSTLAMNQRYSSIHGSRDDNDVMILFARIRFSPAAIVSLRALVQNLTTLDAEHISIEMHL